MSLIALNLFLLSCAINTKQFFVILYNRSCLNILFLLSILSYNIIFIFSLDKGISAFGGLFTITYINANFSLFINLVSLIIILLNTHYPRKIWKENNFIPFSKYYESKIIANCEDDKFKITEYSLILLFILTGGQFLMTSSDVISTFLSIELQSYGLYILCTTYRNSESSTSSGLTYFLLGGLASCFILLSTSILYANSGCTSLENFYIISNIYNSVKYMQLDYIHILNWYNPYYIYISLIILSIGFLIKISAAPFHFWSPDVYDGVPTVVTTFISILPKITILIYMLDLVVNININVYDQNWSSILIISSLVSLFIGTVLGLTQTRIKRLFAYSTISHLGFLLLALAINARESAQAFLFYLTQYSLSNLNAFFILIAIGYSLYTYTYKEQNDKYKITIDKVNTKEDIKNFTSEHVKYEIENYTPQINAENYTSQNNVHTSEYIKWSKEIYPDFTDNTKIPPQSKANSKFYEIAEDDNVKRELNNSPIQFIEQIKGYYYINSTLALSFAITLFSFAGVPPLIGFFAKLMVLSASIDNGFIFMSLIAILTSVIGGVYYLALIKNIFFEDSIYSINYNNINNTIILSSSLTITISILTTIILTFILLPSSILNSFLILSMIILN